MGQRARDLVVVEVFGARHHVPLMGSETVVIVGRDPVAQHVHGLRLILEPRRQLLGHERVRAVGQRQGAGDRVVIGDRDEVHAPPLGELVHLTGGGGALGHGVRAVARRGGDRVAVEVDANVH